MILAENKLLKLIWSVVSVFLHLGSILLVVYFVWPIITLYYNQKPAVGIDLFVSVDFVTYLRDHLNWPWASWKYIWYGGTPLAQTYPLLHFYLIQPLLNWFSAVQAVQVYVLCSIILFFVFSYLFLYTVSKSRGLAIVLSVATAYSYNLWSALYWSGSITYIATTFLLPLSLLLVFLAFERNNRKYIYLGAFLTAIFLLAHPQSFLSYTVPLVTILILFYWSNKVRLVTLDKLFILFSFGIIILFVGFPSAGLNLGVFQIFLNVIAGIFKIGSKEISQSMASELAKQTGGSPLLRILDLYHRSNPLFFYAMGSGFILAILTSITALIVRRKVSSYIKLVLPALAMFLYLILFLYGFVLGINPLTGGWFRAFWPFMTIFSFAIAIFWRITTENLQITINIFNKSTISYQSVNWCLGGAIGILALFFSIPFLQSTYKDFEKETLRYVEISSAMPTVVSRDIQKSQWPEKLPKLVPDWLDTDSLSYRFYDMDATVNIWWNSVFKTPSARGYLDASPSGPSAENYSGWQYWQNVTLNKDEAVEVWDVPEELAREQAKFLIDWHGIKYLEGIGDISRLYGSKISSYITNEPEVIKRSETVNVKGPIAYWDQGTRYIRDQDQILKFYEVDDRSTSPIYSSTNAPSILVVGDRIGQDIMMRNFAFLNLNSKKAIIVQWNKPIDDLKIEELAKFDLVVLYRYKYKSQSKAFAKLENYVKSGGNVFVDTGTEQKESEAKNLPAVFPFEAAERKPLGKIWDWQIVDNLVTKDIDFNIFADPIYNDGAWSFTYPTSSLKAGAIPLVSNHQQSVLILYPLGQGKIIWSGMNFSGHLQSYKNLEEVKLFKNILFSFSDFSQDNNLNVSYARPSSEKVIIKGSGAKAILFKEAAYPGWKLKVRSEGTTKNVPIYEAGPMVPGYIYAVLPQEMQGKPFEAVFQYYGEFTYKISYLISFLSIIFVLDYLLLKGWLIKKLINPFFVRLGHWWEKEEEI